MIIGWHLVARTAYVSVIAFSSWVCESLIKVPSFSSIYIYISVTHSFFFVFVAQYSI